MPETARFSFVEGLGKLEEVNEDETREEKKN